MSDLRRASRTPLLLHNEPLHNGNGRHAARDDEPIGISANAALTAAVQFMPPEITPQYSRSTFYEAWQDEAWSFYESLGEFNYGVNWFSEALSRCRLNVGILAPGGDEPEILKSGVATDIIESLAGGIDGQAAMMRSFGVQLATPGECYLVGSQVRDLNYEAYTGVLLDAEPDESGHVWTVQPKSALRKSQRTWTQRITKAFGSRDVNQQTWEMQVDDLTWMQLSPESLVVRLWNRNERLPWRAMSPAKGALATMREIDMYNRYIIATLVSRIALNGVWLIPAEVTLPVNPAYENQQDPFFAQLLDVMRQVIKNPGSPASAAPLPLRVPSDLIDKFKHLTFATPLDNQIFSAREGAIKRLAASINLPQEVLTGMGATNHWCVDTDTEILTVNGWVKEDQLSTGNEVLTLDHETGLSEWQPVQDIYRADVVDELMTSIESRYHSSLTTQQHRWPVLTTAGRVWSTTETLRPSCRIIGGAPHKDIPATAKYEDAFVELVGWFFTEGTCRYGSKTNRETQRPQVLIGQSHKKNADKVARIRRTLTQLFGPANTTQMEYHSGTAQWRETAHPTDMTLFSLNKWAAMPLLEVAPDRNVKLEFIRELTEAQLELFLNAAASGDGVVNQSDGVQVSQRDPQRVDPIEYAGILAGRAVLRTSRMTNGFKAGPLTIQSVLPRMRTMVKLTGKTRTHEKYTGRVWCPVTQNGTWLARRNGKVFYTGNSAYQLTEDAIKIHISPTAETITRCLTVGYLYPMLRAIDEPIRDAKTGGRYIVWYDPSPLTQRPDRSDLAIQLSDRALITDEATLRETGFSESDMPSDEERDKILLRKLVLSAGPMTLPAYEKLTGEVLVEQPPPGMPGEVPADDSPAPSGGPGGPGESSSGEAVSNQQATTQTSSKATQDTQRPPQTDNAKAPTTT